MSEHEDRVQETRTGQDDERVGALLRVTGRRPAVPVDRAERVRRAVHAAWRDEISLRLRRRRVRFAAVLAAAAAVVAAVGILRWPTGRVATGIGIAARVERVSGASASSPGDEIAVGTTIATGTEGRLAVRTATGHSVRLDTDTRVEIVAARTIVLERGGVYVESRLAASEASVPIEVITALGSVTDTGTQFEVRTRDGAVRIRVREGSVAVEGDGGRIAVQEGGELRLAAGGEASRGSIDPADPSWAWASDLAPAIRIDGLPAAIFLEWAARERGLRLEYDGEAVARAAGETRLAGSIEGMTVDEALASVLPACGLRHRVEADALVIAWQDDFAEAL